MHVSVASRGHAGLLRTQAAVVSNITSVTVTEQHETEIKLVAIIKIVHLDF